MMDKKHTLCATCPNAALLCAQCIEAGNLALKERVVFLMGKIQKIAILRYETTIERDHRDYRVQMAKCRICNLKNWAHLGMNPPEPVHTHNCAVIQGKDVR